MAKLACYSNYLVTFYFCIPVSYEEEDIFFFLMLVLEILVETLPTKVCIFKAMIFSSSHVQMDNKKG